MRKTYVNIKSRINFCRSLVFNHGSLIELYFLILCFICVIAFIEALEVAIIRDIELPSFLIIEVLIFKGFIIAKPLLDNFDFEQLSEDVDLFTPLFRDTFNRLKLIRFSIESIRSLNLKSLDLVFQESLLGK